MKELEELQVSVVIPCLNEEENIVACVRASLRALEEGGLVGEVIVADNGSTDASARLAEEAGARVISELRRGYGSAYLAGLAAARGEFIVMGDADLTYDFAEIPRFVSELEGGAQLVMGDRMDGIQPGAMPWLHQYVGNPVLSGTLNLFFRTGVKDAHCGMRALRRDILPLLDLRTTGMEFASEMVIRAGKERLKISQIAISYAPRGGTSKLNTWRDGWRHLRFLLVHSPTWLFILPGLLVLLFGLMVCGLAQLQIPVFGRQLQIHSLIAGMLAIIVGVQTLSMGLCAHAYAAYFMGEKRSWFARVQKEKEIRLEHGLLVSSAMILAGLGLIVFIFIGWASTGFSTLEERQWLMVGAAGLTIIGVQALFTSFLLSILGLRRDH